MENNLSIIKDQFKELPNNIEAEQAVIGSILVSNDIFDEISTIISSINFYDPMHQKIYEAIESLIYKGMLANPITLKNYFEDEKDDLNVPEYLVKITKFSTSVRQAVEYSKIIYDMFVRRELIKISEQTIDTAKLNDLNTNGQNIIENSERLLFDLAEKGSFNSSLIKFDDVDLIQDLKEIQTEYEDVSKNADILGITEKNNRFHRRLAKATGNRFIIAQHADLHNLARRLSFFVYSSENVSQKEFKLQVSRITRQHYEIIGFIQDKNRSELVALLTEHAVLFRSRLSAVIGGSADKELDFSQITSG